MNPVVLVVEDDDLGRVILCDQVGESGYQVLDVPNGEEALVVLRGGDRVDIVVTDYRLSSDMDGATFIGEARKLRPALPVIMMSGAAPDIIPKGISFLRKPFRRQQLDELLNELTGGVTPSPDP